MEPELEDVLARLISAGGPAAPALARRRRMARGELVSVYPELRVALWAAVSLLTAGVGLLIRQHYREIGPITVALVIGIACALCVVFVVRRAPAFSWDAVPSPTAAFEYVLLAAVTLLGSEMAFLESQFRILGPSWEYHLLVYSIVCLVAAYRYDSSIVLSLAVSSFAAWRGVSARIGAALGPSSSRLRENALACGVIFLAIGIVTVRRRRKPHFEAVWIHASAILILGTLLSGTFGSGTEWGIWELALLVVAGAGALAAFRAKRSAYFAECVLAAYVGSLRVVFDVFKLDEAGLLVVAGSAAAVIFGLARAHRRMKA